MKNSKIHQGLEKSELRDFFSLSIVKIYEEEIKNKKEAVDYHPTNENAIQWAIDDCERYLILYTKKLELLKQQLAIRTMINMLGWEEFDVSDVTEKDLEYRLKLSFIGTQSEYNDLISALTF